MLTSEILKQVRRIQVRTGRQVADVLAGEYLSVFKGRGMEFDEVRPYVVGDDVRTIDWNVTARSGIPYVKRYVEERQLTILLLVDISASQDFGSAGRSKREAASELSALLAFSAIQNDDKVGLLLFHGEVEKYIPPRKGQRHALRVVREVLARGDEEGLPARSLPGSLRQIREWWRLRRRIRRDPRRATRIGAAMEFCRRVIPRRAILFVLSDFLDDDYIEPMRNANRRHDVVAVFIHDRRESDPQEVGLLAIEDAESGAVAVVDTSSAAWRRAAQEVARSRLEGLRSRMRSSGIDLVEVDAAGSIVDPLVAFFRMRQRRLRR